MRQVLPQFDRRSVSRRDLRLAIEEALDPYKSIADWLHSLITLDLPEWRYHDDLPHPEDLAIDDSSWPVIHVDERWNGPRVLRHCIEIPQKINGYAIKGSRVKLELYCRSGKPLTMAVFSNGSLAAYSTHPDMQQPIPLTENARPGERFQIAVRLDGSPRVHSRIAASRLSIEPTVRIDPNLIRQQILAVRALITAYRDENPQRERELLESLKAINFHALAKGNQKTFDDSLIAAQRRLNVFYSWMKQFTIHAVGNAHIDMVWLWPWTETVEIVRDTFRSVLNLIREYPGFRFSMASAQAYAWMEEKYPDIFEEIRERVKEGRWEIVGGMWVEPDLNMPGGESLVRQIVYGKRYFQTKFGVDVRIGWNPDSFGFCWQLPQIYKKSGIDYFVTNKILWAKEFTEFAHKLFWWESPDGTKVLTYFPRDYGGKIQPEDLAEQIAVWGTQIYGDRSEARPDILHPYGVGDHGGGPTRLMLDAAIRWMKPDVVFPNLRFSTVAEFFEQLETRLPDLDVPTWRDELYFEYHRGVFTSQAECKRAVRRLEEQLLDAEKFSTVASLYGFRLPVGDLERAWKELLFHQFHDLFPGTSIAAAYADAQINLKNAARIAGSILVSALDQIAARINTQGPGVPVVIFNSLCWQREEVIEIEAQLPSAAQGIEVLDANGQSLPAHLLSMDRDTNRVRMLVLVKVPALGYKTVYLCGADGKSVFPCGRDVRITTSPFALENEFLRVTVDSCSGCITSLWDKRTGMEALAPSESDTGGPGDTIYANLLQAFRDTPKEWDAWNIDADFEKEFWNIDQADEVELLENGPLRGVIRVRKHFQNSSFIQDIILTAGSHRVDVRMEVEWNEKHILLKVAFPLNAKSDSATFEIPYGSIERPTTRNTPAEQAKFEVPALRWADLSDESSGFSLLNDSKYGYDAKANVLRLSLLRSPDWPDPHADEGRHQFTYSLYPHAGTWRDALTVRRGYELNYKLIARQVQNHDGSLLSQLSFLQTEGDNIVVTAFKQAEEGDGWIIRFYEWDGKHSLIKLRLPRKIIAAVETNLMENHLTDLSFKDDLVEIPTRPYEIKTIRVYSPK